MEWVVLGMCFAAILFVIISGRIMAEQAKEDGVRLKTAYETALASGDKRAALDAGRKYYSHLRKGELTLYDEQAIANDLSAIKQQP